MATFRCLTSGQTVTFTYQHDIDSMRGHQGYVRVDEHPPVEEESKQITLSPPREVKKMGRPKKVASHG
jgi:hypothetical protein